MKLTAGVHPGLEQAQRQLFAAHGRDIHFTGCGIGLRTRKGSATDEPVVTAMVTKKLPAGAVSRSRLLPRTVEADGRRWGVDVVEAGPVAPLVHRKSRDRPDVGGPIIGWYNPPLQGCSVSGDPFTAGNVNTGTFGCLVRDLSDQTVCVLGSNSILAQDDGGPIGETTFQPSIWDAILQGGQPDAIAKLKRYVRFRPSVPNYVDAAIAQLDSQTGYSQAVANNLMRPISATHPAVGMCSFGDSQGFNIFLTPMAPVTGGPPAILNSLNAELLPATPGSPCTAAPYVGMHLEKVARTSGYTSSTVAALNVILNVGSLSGATFTFENLIWVQAFALPGDSGAIACQGGNGRTFVPPVGNCPLLASVGHYYNLPLTKDNAITTQIQDQFLAQSLVGHLLIGLIYINSDTAVDRVEGKVGSTVEKAYAHTYYDKYLPIVKAALANPRSTSIVITQDNLNDFQFILAGLSGVGGTPRLLTPLETAALSTIYNEVLVPTKGMDYAQLVTYMNNVTVYEKVIAALRGVPTIGFTGTIGEEVLPKQK